MPCLETDTHTHTRADRGRALFAKACVSIKAFVRPREIDSMISVLVATSLVAAARGAEPDVFERLASTYGVHSRVKLYTPPGGERGLYATSRVKAGEPVLAVPFELCLVCVAEAGDESITSPWDAPHRDAKDTMLARKLLYALGKGAAIPDDAAVTPVQQAFWQEWQEMLPPMGSLSHPVTLLEAALEDLHDGRLAKAALLQQGRVDAVLADVAQASTDERRWAVALSSSRPSPFPWHTTTSAARRHSPPLCRLWIWPTTMQMRTASSRGAAVAVDWVAE